MKELNKGETLERAALKSGMSENTARRYRKGAAPKGRRPGRTYRTRPDPFEAVWPEVEKMLEAAPGLEGKTIFGRLLERPDTTFSEGQSANPAAEDPPLACRARAAQGSDVSAGAPAG